MVEHGRGGAEERIPGLDGVRALAVMGVIASRASLIGKVSYGVRLIRGCSASGYTTPSRWRRRRSSS